MGKGGEGQGRAGKGREGKDEREGEGREEEEKNGSWEKSSKISIFKHHAKEEKPTEETKKVQAVIQNET